jgi:hypothetical protein
MTTAYPTLGLDDVLKLVYANWKDAKNNG